MSPLVLTLAIVAIFAALSLLMAAGWAIQQRTGHSGWIDAVWTFSLGAVGLISALVPLHGPDWTMRQIVVAALVAFWSLRLGSHIVSRNRRISDDPRYAEIARQYGPHASRGMFWLCQKQAWVSVPLALSIFLAAQNPVDGFRLQDWLALIVLAVAILGETLADAQLRRFASRPENKGRVCDAGLWRWSRHPNYFFEWLGWCAYPLFAVDLTGVYPYGFIALAGPVCMYWLLVYVSGLPPLEQRMLRTRGRQFQDYQARTSAFFPLPPRR